jgi:hypothetical protein
MVEQRGVVHFLWVKNMEAKDFHKEMLPIWAKTMEAKDIHKKRTTPRCSIVLHVFRGAAIL